MSVLALAAGLTVGLALRPSGPARAQSPQAGGRPRELFAVAGQITPGTYGLYLVDAEAASVALYEYVPDQRLLHLRACRSVRYDLQLEQYNTAPDVAEMADLVREARRAGDVTPPE